MREELNIFNAMNKNFLKILLAGCCVMVEGDWPVVKTILRIKFYCKFPVIFIRTTVLSLIL